MKAPTHLKPDTRRWFESVADSYRLEEHHLKLLQLAAEAWDEVQEARTIIKRDGMVTETGGGGLKTHPAVGIERDARLAFARLIRELDLDVDPPPSDRVGPPPLKANRRPYNYS